jgi:chromate transporter
MHRELVEERPWLTEEEFLRPLSFCMLLPGPEAMQLATFAGWRLHGVRGGLIAGGLCRPPGALVIFAMAFVYSAVNRLMECVQALFLGVKATVVVIVIEAILRVARRALRRPAHWVLAGLAFVALFLFARPLSAGGRSRRPLEAPSPPLDRAAELAPPSRFRWPVLLATLATRPGPLVVPRRPRSPPAWASSTDLASSSPSSPSVTFGGAYASSATWRRRSSRLRLGLPPPQLMDALGLAETRPAP